jgi:hypothetical protein
LKCNMGIRIAIREGDVNYLRLTELFDLHSFRIIFSYG